MANQQGRIESWQRERLAEMRSAFGWGYILASADAWSDDKPKNPIEARELIEDLDIWLSGLLDAARGERKIAVSTEEIRQKINLLSRAYETAGYTFARRADHENVAASALRGSRMTPAQELIVTNLLVDNGIKTGDAVWVGRETWLVAYAERGQVCCCGWPESIVPASRCALKRIGTVSSAIDLLNDMALIGGSRGEYARRKLAQIEGALR